MVLTLIFDFIKIYVKCSAEKVYIRFCNFQFDQLYYLAIDPEAEAK